MPTGDVISYKHGSLLSVTTNGLTWKMFSSFSSYVWGSHEGVQEQANNGEVLYDDSKVTEDDWVLVEEIKHGSGSQEEGRVSSLQTLFEENEPQYSETTKETVSGQGSSSMNDNTDLSDKSSLGILIPTKQSDASDKSSLEILFVEAHQSSESENKDISDISMKTDETDFDAKTSLQFLFDEPLHTESTKAGNNSASLFTLQPLPDPPIILAPNTGQSRHPYNRSYSADCYRGDPEVVIEPTMLRRRHVTRLSKRSGDSTGLVGNVVLQKRTKQPSLEGTSGVGRGEETRGRTRRANSVACGQNDNTHGRRKKRTGDKCSGKGGRRNC